MTEVPRSQIRSVGWQRAPGCRSTVGTPNGAHRPGCRTRDVQRDASPGVRREWRRWWRWRRNPELWWRQREGLESFARAGGEPRL
eukprot:scaffold7381_cov310-Pinguiococcus_pyrenoidosus.AAC.134